MESSPRLAHAVTGRPDIVSMVLYGVSTGIHITFLDTSLTHYIANAC